MKNFDFLLKKNYWFLMIYDKKSLLINFIENNII